VAAGSPRKREGEGYYHDHTHFEEIPRAKNWSRKDISQYDVEKRQADQSDKYQSRKNSKPSAECVQMSHAIDRRLSGSITMCGECRAISSS
jgi:hypothetical protein